MPIYNKLIRDKIPQIISMTGKSYKTRVLEDQEYTKELQKKTKEELQEYLEADNDKDAKEELADLLELIHSLAEVHSSSIEEIEIIREKKAEQRGGFKEKIFLIEVEDD